MPTPDLQRAAQALRDSVAALPDGLRAHSWDSDYGLVLSSRYDAGGEVVAECILGRQVAPGEQKETARHIARTASPDVVTAVADLLASVAAALPWIDSAPGRSGTASILSQRAEALAAAILGGDGHDE